MLRLLALGHTNQEIAKQLYISVRTAETHRAHIMQKLRLSSRAELVRHALVAGPPRRGRERRAVASPGRRQWVIVPLTLPTFSSPTCPWSTAAKAWDTNG